MAEETERDKETRKRFMAAFDGMKLPSINALELDAWHSMPSYSSGVTYSSRTGKAIDPPTPVFKPKRKTISPEDTEAFRKELSIHIKIFEVRPKAIIVDKGVYDAICIDIIANDPRKSNPTAANAFVSILNGGAPSAKFILNHLGYLLKHSPPSDPTLAQITKKYLFDFSQLPYNIVQSLLKQAKEGDGKTINFGWVEVFQNISFTQNPPFKSSKGVKKPLFKAQASPPRTKNPWLSNGVTGIVSVEEENQPAAKKSSVGPSYHYVVDLEHAADLLGKPVDSLTSLKLSGGLQIVVDTALQSTQRLNGKPIVIEEQF